MSFAAETIEQLTSLIDRAVADPLTMPGAAVVVFGKDGELFSYAAGKRGLESSEPMAVDTVFWLASCTMITGDIEVVRADGALEQKSNRITLRMPLAHTSGFGYSTSNPLLATYDRPFGFPNDEASPNFPYLSMPLAFHPGEDWACGVCINVAGIALQRSTGMAVGAYIQKHLFSPLGIDDFTFIPTQSMRDRLASMHLRAQDGRVSVQDHPFKASVEVDLKDPKGYSEDRAFWWWWSFRNTPCLCHVIIPAGFLAMLVNQGADPRSGVQLLSKEKIIQLWGAVEVVETAAMKSQ
ncbi:beta-lactamase family [Fusarium beomiforme]|uniref:Beta-lactamase family n=1 Tax=Fusarium beomiforme TaxID=44412 RepID=A0A9P5AG23_9HYPO|nr:beta-lactamase family [Fusarium beomiforme]